MSYSNSTEHYQLPQFQPGDKGNWYDNNTAFEIIDNEMFNNNSLATNAEALGSQNEAKIQLINTEISQIKEEQTTMGTIISTLQDDVTNIPKYLTLGNVNEQFELYNEGSTLFQVKNEPDYNFISYLANFSDQKINNAGTISYNRSYRGHLQGYGALQILKTCTLQEVCYDLQIKKFPIIAPFTNTGVRLEYIQGWISWRKQETPDPSTDSNTYVPFTLIYDTGYNRFRIYPILNNPIINLYTGNLVNIYFKGLCYITLTQDTPFES